MTYRKLFLLLFATGTLLLGTLWWRSDNTDCWVTFSSPRTDFNLGFYIGGGTAMLMLQDSGGDGTGWTFNTSRTGPMDDQPSPWPAGSFGIDWSTEEMINPTKQLHFFELDLPLWSIWLTFSATTFAFCRVMERRAIAVEEKRLAEGERERA